MAKIIILLFTLLFLFSCQESPPKPNPYIEEVKALKNDEQKNKFLEAIYDVDQDVRKVNTNDGRMKKTDQVNFQKIEAYLNIHGHPKFQDHGPKAAMTPWLVLHHEGSPNSEKIRRQYFPIMYQAYLDKNIDEGNLSFYLNRAYQIKFGKLFNMPSPFKGPDEIDTLLKMLDYPRVEN